MEKVAIIEAQLASCEAKEEETRLEIEKTGTLFVRAKEAADVIQDF